MYEQINEKLLKQLLFGTQLPVYVVWGTAIVMNLNEWESTFNANQKVIILTDDVEKKSVIIDGWSRLTDHVFGWLVSLIANQILNYFSDVDTVQAGIVYL